MRFEIRRVRKSHLRAFNYRKKIFIFSLPKRTNQKRSVFPCLQNRREKFFKNHHNLNRFITFSLDSFNLNKFIVEQLISLANLIFSLLLMLQIFHKKINKILWDFNAKKKIKKNLIQRKMKRK